MTTGNGGLSALIAYLPLIAVVSPFLFSGAVALCGERFGGRLRTAVAVASTLVVFACVLGMWRGAESATAPASALTAWVTLRRQPQPFGFILALVSSFLWMFTVVYSVGYMAHEHAKTRYFTFLVMVEGATLGIVMAADLLTLFVFFEILTVGVYPLVVHEQTDAAFQAGKTYLLFLVTAETVVFGLVAALSWQGSLPPFQAGGVMTGLGFGARAAAVTAAACVLGFGVKGGVMPLHVWLPDAMIAPTPVSAVLHAVAVVKVGVFGLIAGLYLIIGSGLARTAGVHRVLPWVAAFTIIMSSLMALRQDEIKRRLAYSTVSQLGYIVFGASLLVPEALKGALLHIFAHSLMKIVLFFCAGLIISQTGKRYFSEISGLARRMPITMACFSVGALGMVGMPPVVGWISKWVLLSGTFKSGNYVFVGIILLSAFLNMGYYLPPIYTAYFGRLPEGEEPVKGREAPLSMTIPTAILAAMALVFGVYPALPYTLAARAAAAIY